VVKKKKTNKGKAKTVKKERKGKGKKRPRREEEDDDDDENTTLWETKIVDNLFLKLHLWEKTDGHYINFRRGRNFGVNIPIEYFWDVVGGLTTMRKKHKELFPPQK